MSTPLTTTFIIKKQARHALIKELFETWLSVDPKGAKAAIKYIREITSQDIASSGAYDTSEHEVEGREGFVQYRLPSDLFWLLRKVIPDWGNDDADIKELICLYPDLMPRAMRKRLRGTGPNRRRIEKR